MPDFDKLFLTERSVKYKNTTIFRTDYISFVNGDKFLVIFEKTNSEWTQGMYLYAYGFFDIEGRKYKDKIVLWENTAPKQMIFTLLEETTKRYRAKGLPKRGILGIKNVWEIKSLTGYPCIDSGHHGAAMIVEEIENGRRYRCNDGHPDDNFDDIVFTIQKIS